MTFDSTNRICKAMLEMLTNPRGNTMSDRWGPSVDCTQCGRACSRIAIKYCEECGQEMCTSCWDEHVCETPEAEDAG